MENQKLYDVLFSMNPLPEALRSVNNRHTLIAYINSRIAVSHHNHRQLLLNKGQIADHIYFVEAGLARGYFYDEEKQKEYTVWLWDEMSIITEPNSFFKKTSSELYVEVMPGSKLLSLSGGQLADVFDRFPDTDIFSRCLMLHYFASQSRRIYDLIGLSAWERYLKLLDKYPNIEQKTSKEIIASYLGITPQSLSRLLKENGHP
jgi:CRP-like cAMP-binding protein